MRIWIFSLCRNESDILPWYLRNYGAIAEKIIVWDDESTDGSTELLMAHPKVSMREWPYPTSGIDEDLFLQFAQEQYRLAAGHADWVMWVDCDEIIHCADLKGAFEAADAAHADVIKPSGWNMTGDGLPADNGLQIWQVAQMGVPAPVYAKPVIFRPTSVIRWNRGKHALENCSPKIITIPDVKLLHYRYMGGDYTRKKNRKNYDRVGLANGDKGAAWSCAPTWHGEHSPEWADQVKARAINVIAL